MSPIRAVSRLAAVLVLMALAAPNSGAQQIIMGKIRHDKTNAPVDEATIQLLNASRRPLDRVQKTNKHGAFTMQVEQGRYRLSIRRIGYDPIESDIIDVQPGRNINLSYVMTPISLRLTEQIVTAQSRLERGRDGMRKREAENKGGFFLYRNDFREIVNKTVPEILEMVPGIRSRPDGSVETLEGWRCLQFLLNRLPITEVPIQTMMNLNAALGSNVGFASIYEMLPDGHDIMGIEVYRSFKEVPNDLRQDAWPDRDAKGVTAPRVLGTHRRAENQPLACGLVNFWTSAAW